MARAIWSGVVSFGLVSVPVQLFTATEDHTVHFHQLQRGTSDRIRNRRINERTGKEVDHDDIVKGYEVDGTYVIVEPEELDEIAPGKSQVIDIRGFVDVEQIEPVYFARTYYLAPKAKEYTKVYELLRAALGQADKAGIATLVMRGKQYLVALRAQEDVLAMHTLHWADEVRDPHQELPYLPERRQARGRDLDTARQLIDALSIAWRPKDYHDTYEEKVGELVAAKAKGQEVVGAEEPPEATDVVDLMETLRNSVEEARKGRGTRGAEGTRRRSQDLHDLSKADLYRLAGDRDVPGRSRMNRDQLIKALGTKTTGKKTTGKRTTGKRTGKETGTRAGKRAA
ncbi:MULTISPECIES: Ku protein [unclassified Streptomyces]|uniref:non-homologous end joining protein Ku n=1 Tax=unclassified Streptomyces TaxID=2593676 RepID=UPI0003781A1C|nr:MULTISPECIES: Ku protein [unclassified Streptomyces]MYT28651.1 Ku protein [Streptomyces sp. SID8354]